MENNNEYARLDSLLAKVIRDGRKQKEEKVSKLQLQRELLKLSMERNLNIGLIR